MLITLLKFIEVHKFAASYKNNQSGANKFSFILQDKGNYAFSLLKMIGL